MIGSAEVALLLLQRGAAVPSARRDTFNFSPLFHAARHNMTAVAALLKAKGHH